MVGSYESHSWLVAYFCRTEVHVPAPARPAGARSRGGGAVALRRRGEGLQAAVHDPRLGLRHQDDAAADAGRAVRRGVLMWGYVAALGAAVFVESLVIVGLVTYIWANNQSFKKLLGLVNAAGWKRLRADRQPVHGPNVHPFVPRRPR